ncbi:prephenate dehydratase [Cytophagaceae bacterium ABcell3]|nr:prephenate dehydratase [Cytophagaceae bacterium ABcell3]
MKIAIQGGQASFHDIAARLYFGNHIESVPCNSFKELSEVLAKGDADFAVMAIENAIAGSILHNYALIREYDFGIIGEIQLRIEMNLMALPGIKLEDLKIVRSHYMALLQCEEFFSRYPHLKLEEYHDTADSARDIRKNNRTKIGAVAGRMAASLYNLEILAEGIETEKRNFTRFYILSRDKKFKIDGEGKATISFQLSNEVGALANMLSIIVNNNINLTKIQSLPILGKPNEYTFYVDCEWSDYEDFRRSIEVKNKVKNLKILGEYKKGETIHDYSKSFPSK